MMMQSVWICIYPTRLSLEDIESSDNKKLNDKYDSVQASLIMSKTSPHWIDDSSLEYSIEMKIANNKTLEMKIWTLEVTYVLDLVFIKVTVYPLSSPPSLQRLFESFKLNIYISNSLPSRSISFAKTTTNLQCWISGLMVVESSATTLSNDGFQV
ncbi:hypothetical protein QVD17_28196 [Tagetes erecta]|uniref:Uncharacterized protein n=1 Tax=Tagetes erecta TaxID=13708 RepID=A0AAD8NK95_TARER|nr:hypothetical protein QVD17_28196 [Tagetes erecta]